ncbi:MAG: hypothetical protein K1060chlam4_00300 [Candidatus Anoxychlamydiales bacterium]|nr:hypothetical protein [Candidatus Anoxychlamydiales bacterium]
MTSPASNEATNSFPVKLKWNKALKGKDLDFKNRSQFHKSFIHLHRKIEQQYKNLPWPPAIKRATVMTEAPGGRGDLAAAGKVIGIIQQLYPSLEFDWAVVSGRIDPKPFLTCSEPSKVHISYPSLKDGASDLLIVGPAKCGWGTDYIQSRIGVKIDGPRFSFLEAGTKPCTTMGTFIACKTARENLLSEEKNKVLSKIHKYLFSTRCDSTIDGICMGLVPGSGIIFDQSRLDTSLSRGYCCPAPLLKIVDTSLREDILRSLDNMNKDMLPNFDLHSFNSGYAHRPSSWGKFIDFVAIQEREKHVTIVLNQHGEFDKPNSYDFGKMIFTPERQKFLRQMRYGKIIVKGEESEPLMLQTSTENNQRNLTVIIRPSFEPEDMKQLQLASERLIATGMNTPAESWASKCKLYIYEDVANGGVTNEFLKQQIKIAKKVNPKLGRLLQIAGRINKPLSSEEMAEVTEILHDPELSTATLNFCDHIISNYRFQDALVSSLKRVMWHHYIPELIKVEADAMDDDFKEGILKYFGSFDAEKQVVIVKNLPVLAQSVQRAVNAYLAS